MVEDARRKKQKTTALCFGSNYLAATGWAAHSTTMQPHANRSSWEDARAQTGKRIEVEQIDDDMERVSCCEVAKNKKVNGPMGNI